MKLSDKNKVKIKAIADKGRKDSAIADLVIAAFDDPFDKKATKAARKELQRQDAVLAKIEAITIPPKADVE